MGFANLSQQPNSTWLSRGLSVYLTTELGAGGKLMIIPDETVARARAELKIGDSDGFSPETLARIRNNLGADLVLSGAYTMLPASGSANGPATKSGDQLRVDLRLQNAVTGEMLPSVSETGNAAGLFDLVSRVGADARQDLGVESATPTELTEGKSSLSSNPTALKLYAEGIDKLRTFDALRAGNLLEESVTADPKFALTHSALAETWLTLGYEGASRFRC
jgi:TolB-like protein